MTKKEAIALFNERFPKTSFVKNGWVDKPMRDQAWNDFTDALQKDGQITARQYSSWVHPYNGR